MSDLHLDHPNSDHDLIAKHLNLAKKTNAAIIIGGDLFDAMQLRSDPRRSYGGLREDHKKDDYIDAIIDSAVKMLKKHADHILAIADGNHETAVLRNAATHITKRVCEAIGCQHLPYRGWMRWGDKAIYYAHGASGHSAPVTLGVIDVARQRAWADADVIWNGHSHTAYVIPFVKFSGDGRRLCWAVRTPSYIKFQFGSAWGDEKGLAPQPNGCAMIERTADGVLAHLIVV